MRAQYLLVFPFGSSLVVCFRRHFFLPICLVSHFRFLLFRTLPKFRLGCYSRYNFTLTRDLALYQPFYNFLGLQNNTHGGGDNDKIVKLSKQFLKQEVPIGDMSDPVSNCIHPSILLCTLSELISDNHSPILKDKKIEVIKALYKYTTTEEVNHPYCFPPDAYTQWYSLPKLANDTYPKLWFPPI